MWKQKKGSAGRSGDAETYEGLPVDRRYARGGRASGSGNTERRAQTYRQETYERSGNGGRQKAYPHGGKYAEEETYGHHGDYNGTGAYYGQTEYAPQSSFARPQVARGQEAFSRRGAQGRTEYRGSDPRRERPYRRGADLNRGGRRGGDPGGYAGMPVPRRKKRHPFRTFLKVLLILALLLGALAFVVLGRMDHTRLGSLIRNSGLVTGSSCTNIALYGVDSRTGGLTSECHSDAIMICSLNRDTKEIRIASVYRDTYLDNTNGEFRKATECYYFGGPERSVNMLNKNLDLDISDYVTVNFNAVVEAIDLLGGIDLEVTDEEVRYINGYCVENEQVTGASYTPLTNSGYVHLSGTQALAYCRIRYTEGWDFKRTERQRTVLTLVFQKAVEKGPAVMASIINTMLPSVSTSMNSVEILALAAGLGGYKLADQCGFPFDKTSADLVAGDCVVPVNLASNVTQLHAFLFGDTDYVPSETVQAISDQISNDTGVW